MTDETGKHGRPPGGHGSTPRARRWREAAETALYGPDGFYLRTAGPAAHFRTSVHASGLFAAAVARLLTWTAEALDTDEVAFVDMGAGRGELVTGVLGLAPEDLRVQAYAVERAPRPPGLDPRVSWCATPPTGVSGLLFGNEWLDNVPVDVAGTDQDGVVRYVLVRPDGTEEPGDPVEGADAEWLARWWPAAGPGSRAEIGRPRDLAWAAAVSTLERGLAVAADYAHVREARPLFGTLTGFRDGREVAAVPDGSCDLTAHVALDACALPGAELTVQRAALHRLGVRGDRPPAALAATEPAAYLRALVAAGEAAELTARGGLGDFGWLMQPVGITLTAPATRPAGGVSGPRAVRPGGSAPHPPAVSG